MYSVTEIILARLENFDLPDEITEVVSADKKPKKEQLSLDRFWGIM